MFKLNDGDKAQIEFIVDKFHVATNNREIIREFYNRMKGNYSREQRKAVYKYALKHHKENFKFYAWVMGSH